MNRPRVACRPNCIRCGDPMGGTTDRGVQLAFGMFTPLSSSHNNHCNYPQTFKNVCLNVVHCHIRIRCIQRVATSVVAYNRRDREPPQPIQPSTAEAQLTTGTPFIQAVCPASAETAYLHHHGHCETRSTTHSREESLLGL